MAAEVLELPLMKGEAETSAPAEAQRLLPTGASCTQARRVEPELVTELPGEDAVWKGAAADELDLHEQAAEAQAAAAVEPYLVAPNPGQPRAAGAEEYQPSALDSTRREPPRPIRKPAERNRPERCAIVVWRGYAKSQFFARGARGGAIASSAMFRARGGSSPDKTTQSEEALAGLLKQLRQLGWSVVDEGPQWFDRRLERRPAHDERR